MKTFRSPLAVAALSAVLFQGCFASRVSATGPAGSTHSSAGASLFWGIGTPHHGATECSYGLKEVTMYRPWYSHFVGLLTLGIVTPITSEWVCLEAPRAAAPVAPAAPAAQ